MVSEFSLKGKVLFCCQCQSTFSYLYVVKIQKEYFFTHNIHLDKASKRGMPKYIHVRTKFLSIFLGSEKADRLF